MPAKGLQGATKDLMVSHDQASDFVGFALGCGRS